MPASRVIVNSPTTHGAIGFSTALPPSMTLGCGSWGGNVTSDNVSPLHLMDIKRVAFETRPVKSARPALAAQGQSAPPAAASSAQPMAAQSTGRAIGREEIAAIVDRFLSNRPESQPAPAEHAHLHATASPAPSQPVIDVEAGSRYDSPEAAPQAAAAPTAEANGGNGSASSAQTTAPPPADKPAQNGGAAASSSAAGQATNGNARKAVDFVSEDDVRRAIQKGEKIYVNARTIITPSARDMGEPAEVFAKV
jgi:acetaldehyde dehydrogenase (acetylating)